VGLQGQHPLSARILRKISTFIRKTALLRTGIMAELQCKKAAFERWKQGQDTKE